MSNTTEDGCVSLRPYSVNGWENLIYSSNHKNNVMEGYVELVPDAEGEFLPHYMARCGNKTKIPSLYQMARTLFIDQLALIIQKMAIKQIYNAMPDDVDQNHIKH